jgi:O-acetylhomoserine/O-acetylserine sulfhydrylase-like pyridoxal-dependent enzyme
MSKEKKYTRWDIDCTFAGTNCHAIYTDFRANSKIEAEIRGLAYVRMMNPRSTVLKVKVSPSEKRAFV